MQAFRSECMGAITSLFGEVQAMKASLSGLAAETTKASLSGLAAETTKARAAYAEAAAPTQSAALLDPSFAEDIASNIWRLLAPGLMREVDKIIRLTAEKTAKESRDRMERVASITHRGVVPRLAPVPTPTRSTASQFPGAAGQVNRESSAPQEPEAISLNAAAHAEVRELCRSLDRDGNGKATGQEAIVRFNEDALSESSLARSDSAVTLGREQMQVTIAPEALQLQAAPEFEDTIISLDAPTPISDHALVSVSRGDVASQASPSSRPRAGTEEARTEKALVVNFRRLIKMREFFCILHEVMRSTTIAFLTLMAVESPGWLVVDLAALLACVGVYALHANKFDKLEVTDFNNLVELLADDCESALKHAKVWMENPNRWLQAVTFSRSWRNVLAPYLSLTFFLAGDIFSWFYVLAAWSEAPILEMFPDWAQPADDISHAVTLLLVGTLMLVCQLMFELIHWRETQYCLPWKGDRPWQLGLGVGKDGYPRDWHFCWLFGPPCIWFSTPQAYDDLRIWVTLAAGKHGHCERGRRERVLPKVFFEELALYAIQDKTTALRLNHSLSKSKLYDKETSTFLTRGGPSHVDPQVTVFGVTEKYKHAKKQSSSDHEVSFYKADLEPGGVAEEPEELKLELLFYDDRSCVHLAPGSQDYDAFRDQIKSTQLRTSASMGRSLEGTGSGDSARSGDLEYP